LNFLFTLSGNVGSGKSPRTTTIFRNTPTSLSLRGIKNHTAVAFGVLAAAVKMAGRSPRPRYNDLWIAAQAIENGTTLLTLNGKDFADLPGLRLVSLANKATYGTHPCRYALSELLRKSEPGLQPHRKEVPKVHPKG
jgi:hypothetical protein